MSSRQYKVIGTGTPKLEGVDKVTGRAVFGADVKLPRMLFGKVLRSPHANAIIWSINADEAAALPGVRAVVTGADFPVLVSGEPGSQGPITEANRYHGQEVIARGRVHFHGQPVAAVAATSAEIAEEALDLISVEYEVLPPILTTEKAMEPDAQLLHPELHTKSEEGTHDRPSNVAEHLRFERGSADDGFAQADVVVEESFATQVVHQGYIEPESETALAHLDGRVEVWANTQSVFHWRTNLATILGIPLTDVTVYPTEIGGGFGGKETVRASALCIALSRQCFLPVQIRFDREEVLRATGPGNATRSTIKIGARSNGEIVAIQARMVFDAGAFPGAPLSSAVRRVFSVYRTPNLLVDAFDVVTNKPHVAAYRAPGATPTAFAVESVIDQVADALDVDPLEFRLQNVSRPNDPMLDGALLPDVNLVEVLERVKAHPCWANAVDGPNRGRGLALGMWTMPGGTMSCHVALNADGTVTLVSGAIDLSASRTSLGMIAAEALGLALDRLRVSIGGTDTVSHADGSSGDKVTYIMSVAVNRACDALIASLKDRVADRFGVDVDDVSYDAGMFSVEEVPEMRESLVDLARRSVRRDGPAMGFGSAGEWPGEEAVAPNAAAHVADVEVDPETGKVQVLAYTAFQDVGLAINPDQVEGQMQGGATQGMGWALSEEYLFDDEGVLLNASLLDYRLRTSLDVPSIGAEIVELPSRDHPLGVRAVGQVPIVPPAGAIANAIHRAVGVRMRVLPMNPQAVRRALDDTRP
ncbi:MAG TPA: oxidoreductase [Dehalococcoidia bacterium]|jgi:CO/xanthine dehydrogenase Mo-binding subunit|nr:xanthine dehydrogenase family protein molybdopterin-binding subunit [SAR202 cluster bacterium]HAL46394.1 oxidoreductase [Dehalococcoidia bacterium]